MGKIRIGVVGAGLIWKRAHQAALALRSEQVEITAFCASSDKTRREVAQSHPGVPFYYDYHELVAAPQVDWVLVLPPIALNAPVALAALRAGKHVLLEKPMARTLAEGEELVRLAKATGRRLYVLEQAVYPRYLDTVEEILRSGEIGEVVVYDQVAHEIVDNTPAHNDGGYGETPWRIQGDFPLGALFDGGHHPISRLSRLFGRPAWVHASGRRLRPTYGEYSHVLTFFEYDSGVRGTLSHSTMLSGRQNYLRIRGTRGILTLEAARLVIQPNEGAADAAASRRCGSIARTVALPPDRAYEEMWEAVLRAIAAGQDPYYTGERALQDLSILLAIQRSAHLNGRVSV